MKIISAEPKYFSSFHSTLDQVAREEIYIEMIEAKPLSDLTDFQTSLISKNLPTYYAVNNEDQVIGWIDISMPSNPRLKHRGFLGMGILSSYRGQGIGSQLMNHALKHAKEIGFEKVELSVYSTNEKALALYKKFGFTQFGYVKHFRKLNNRYFDCIEMELFLKHEDSN